MRRSLAVTALFLLASCGQGGGGGEERSPSSGTSDMASAPEAAVDAAPSARAPSAGPDVAVTAAPGVAFNYRYAVRLEAERIAAVQESHARACEQLGINRCRITGMLYRVVREGDIQARLSFRLAPDIARRFGQMGVEAVTRAEGMLVESEITGTDMAPRIDAATRNGAELTEELDRIEARLRQADVGRDERARLVSDAERIRAAIRSVRDTREEAQATLATTPLTFEYGSGDLIPGKSDEWTLAEAATEAGENFLHALAIILILLVTLLPWALLALAGWLLVRWVRRRGWLGATAGAGAISRPEE